MRLSTLLFVLLLALLLGQLWAAYPDLPERMATHFNGSGEADGWSSKASFTWLYAGLVALMALTFWGIAAFLPRLPDALINVPNKEYWLAPERRRATLAYFADQMLWMGNATLLLLLYALRQTIQANLEGGDAALGKSFVVVVLVYLAATIAWSVALIARFMQTPRQRPR